MTGEATLPLLEPGLYPVRVGRFSWLMSRRAMLLVPILLALLAMVIFLSLMAGASWLSPAAVWQAMRHEGPPGTQLLLNEFRLPRIFVAALAGLALGSAGCLIQALTRNRLASPDMLGMADGATLAVMLTLIVSQTKQLGSWWVGPLGAIVAIAVLLAVA
uniref:iron chelate uptake ABC transporter family permease subunit n=1 Tax=Chitinivorax sp. B TaxID=2502235 RepID=UPI0010F94FDE